MPSNDHAALQKQEDSVAQGKEKPGSRWLSVPISVVGMLMIAYHIFSTWFPIFSPILHQNIHLSFALTLLFLTAALRSKTRFRSLYLVGIILGLGANVYIHVNVERLDMWAGFPENWDVVVGLSLVAVVVFLTWKIWGSVFPILLGIGVLYALFGHRIPGALGHAHMTAQLVLSNLGIGLTGIYGMMLNASANLIFLFIIFGSVFETVGIDKFFLEIGYFIGRHLRGGAAQTAVFSSSLVGMCTGAAAANVALTGSYTIPLMKKTGFHPKHAGAIEAVASTGGQLTPPVMGVAIFLMASFLGVSYSELMLKALIPAIVFYAVVAMGVVAIASREKMPMLTQEINWKLVWRSAPLFVIPMGLITYLLVRRYTPAYSAVLALAALLIISMLQKETRPSAKDLIWGFTKGAVMGSGIAVACACIGMFMVMLTSTAAGPRLAGVIQVLAGGKLFIALVLTMVLSIILGCAMPTPVAYVVTALVVAPVLVEMGLNLIAAHFFVFYFAILSAVTPPVAGATIVASQIANCGYMKTGWESLKLVLPFFVVPYFLARNPIVILEREPFFGAVSAIVALSLAALGLLIFCQNYCFGPLQITKRILFLVTALLAVAYGQFGNFYALIAALLLACLLIGGSLKRKRSDPGVIQ